MHLNSVAQTKDDTSLKYFTCNLQEPMIVENKLSLCKESCFADMEQLPIVKTKRAMEDLDDLPAIFYSNNIGKHQTVTSSPDLVGLNFNSTIEMEKSSECTSMSSSSSSIELPVFEEATFVESKTDVSLSKLADITESGKSEEDADKSQKCGVCGDVASGFHYNVISCNGCKTFFRRAVVANRKFVCRKGGNCHFGKDQRCACRACRFKQCITVGMNAQAIQYIPSANLTLSIARKRFQRNFQVQNVKKFRDEKVHDMKNEDNTLASEDEVLKCIGEALRVEERHDRLRSSNFYPYDLAMTATDVLMRPTSFSNADKYQSIEKWSSNKINVVLPIKCWMFVDLYLSIDYIKTFEFFSSMTLEEKIAYVKKTALANQSLTSAYYSYTQRSEDLIIYPDKTFPFYSMKESVNKMEVEIRKGLAKPMSNLQPDQIQFTLFRLIVLLNDDCDKLSEVIRERIAALRLKYTKVLFYYLQNKHGTKCGVNKFTETLMFSNVLARFLRLRHDYFAYRSYVLRNSYPSLMFRECF